MIGFALIIILVSVILLIFLGFSIKDSKTENLESYEVESFLQGLLQHTTNCEDNFEYLSVRKLIFSCMNNEKCLNGEESCEILNSDLNDILEESWKTENSPTKGYVLNVIVNEQELLNLQKGNLTQNYKGSVQYFKKDGSDVDISLKVHS